MVKTVARRKRPSSPTATDFLRFLVLQKQAKDLSTEAGKVKKDLTAHVEKYHTTDEEKGHLIHELPEPIEVNGVKYTGFMKQRKVSQVFDEEKAEALCTEKGFDLEEYTTRVIDQDKVVRLYAEDKITDEEFNSLVSDEEGWAFVPMKA